MLSVAAGAIALVCWIVSPAAIWYRLRARCLPASLHLVRLARWAGYRTVRERLLLILHIGYAFVPIGFLLNACSAFGIVPAGAGIHAWMARSRRRHDAGGDEPGFTRTFQASN